MADFDENTFYILDSYGLIYRCYFAFVSRPLTNQAGQNVSALFGFFRNLHSILKHYKPLHIAAAMDSKSATFRHKLYAEYKATRNKTPEDLHEQIPWIEDVLRALGIPVLQCEGYEADDVIATAAKKCEAAGRTCRILSGDKDLMQLVTDSTQILKPDHADVWKVTGVDGVKAEWGVMPSQLLDLLALFGDTSDNIPGVKGVGVKTSAKLLAEYGTLDGIYAHIGDIKGAVQKKLADGRESAYFSQQLVRLCADVPCPEIDGAVFGEPVVLDCAAAAELLKKFGVPSVAKQYVELAVSSGGGSGEALSDSGGTEAAPSEEGGDGAEIPDESQRAPLVKNSGDYRAVRSAGELSQFVDAVLRSAERTVAFDCETDSLDTLSARMVGFSLCCAAGSAVYVPIFTNDMFDAGDFVPLADALREIARLFDEPSVTVVLHNGKFDYKVLRTAGISFSGGRPRCTLADTMIAEWLLSPDRTGKNAYSLEHLAEAYLGLSGTEYDEIVGKKQTFADVPLEKAAPYAAEDADFTFQLWLVLRERLAERGLAELFSDIEMKLLPVLAEMEIAGIHLDAQTLLQYNEELTRNIEDAQNGIYAEVGHPFNIASTKQLQEVLFTERGLKPGKKTKRGYSTDTSVLEELALFDAVPRMILDYRELSKLQSTYVETLPLLCDAAGRIHTDFIQTGTATGRLSCRDPNLQNIPVRNEAGRRIRSAFTAAPGTVLISADYSQIELVVLAHLSGDGTMCAAFQSGTDIHRATAALIFGVEPEAVTPEMRRTAKTINFGVIYGMSSFRLAGGLGISRPQAAEFIENYFKTYASVRNFMDETVRKAERDGFVETIFGRRRAILSINSRNKIERAGAERVAVNTPVQGSAADIVKKAMLDVDAALRGGPDGARLLVQVHDELILECPDDEQAIGETVRIVREKMENAVALRVPLRVSIECGKNWGEFH
ncbi:MAG: DNA polymerase I [Treponemataceae bacterium]|nr:DNA polymerase I [Treponemataceae bacterium]